MSRTQKYNNTLDAFDPGDTKGAYGTRSGLTPQRARTGRGNKPDLGNSPWCPASEPAYNAQPTEQGSDRQPKRSSGSARSPLTSTGSIDLGVGPKGQEGKEPKHNVQPYGWTAQGNVPKSNRQPTEK